MEKFDAEKAARVWQRVRAGEPAAPGPREESVEVLHQSNALAGLYLGLQRRLTGEARAPVRKLYRQHRELTACLKGMLRLSGATVPGLPPVSPGTGPIPGILESCFHRERRLGDALAGRSGDPALGPVYRLLADQAVHRELAVLALLGEV